MWRGWKVRHFTDDGRGMGRRWVTVALGTTATQSAG